MTKSFQAIDRSQDAPPRPGDHERKRRVRVVPILICAAVIAVVCLGIVADWYVGRRRILTGEWRPFLTTVETHSLSVVPVVSANADPRRIPRESILYRVDGDGPGDYFGFSVAGLGDVDGDGLDDFAVGAHQVRNDDPRPAPLAPAGYVRVFSGADGSELYTVRPIGSLKIDGADDRFGWSIAALGDVSGDRISDLLVGAWLYDADDADPDSNDENTGGVFVFSGATGETLLRIGGESWGDRLGYSLDVIADRDGDGKPDLLLAVEKGETSADVINAGRLQVVSSATREVLVVANGPGFEAHLGSSCTALGDVNGDGVRDFAGGAFMFGGQDASSYERGAAGIFSGRNGEVLLGWTGRSPLDRLGFSICALGDVNGDGIDDVATGAIQSGWHGDYAGPGYVAIHSGADANPLAVLEGAALGAQFGWMVESVGDRNGDGVAELLVGAPAAFTAWDEKLGRRGVVHLFSGDDWKEMATFEGLEVDDQFGASAVSLGDLNGDGIGEILIGAPQNVRAQAAPGYALVVSGDLFRGE